MDKLDARNTASVFLRCAYRMLGDGDRNLAWEYLQRAQEHAWIAQHPVLDQSIVDFRISYDRATNGR